MQNNRPTLCILELVKSAKTSTILYYFVLKIKQTLIVRIAIVSVTLAK